MNERRLETDLREIWRGLLNSRDVAADADFFRMGGNHRLVTRLVSEIKQRFDLDATIREIFANSRFDQQVDLLHRRLEVASSAQVTPEQISLVTAGRLRAGQSTEYNLAFPILLPAPVDKARLARAIQGLVSTHAVLRSYFPSINGKVVAKLCEVSDFPVEILPKAEGDLEAAMEELAARPFDLGQGPAARFHLIRSCPDSQTDAVVMVHHQIVHDGDSYQAVVDDLLDCYWGNVRQDAPRAKSAVSFFDWAKTRGDERRIHDSLEYWRRKLDGYRPTKLELGKSWTPRIGDQTQSFSLAIDAFTERGLRDLAAQCQTDLLTVVLGALAVLLERYCQTSDLAVATMYSHRQVIGTSHSVGYFVTPLILRLAVDENQSFLELIRDQVRPTVLDAIGHASVPPEAIPLAKRTDALFHLVVNCHEPKESARGVDGKRAVASGTARQDLAVDLFANESGWELRFEYSRELYSEPLMRDFANQFLKTVRYVAAHPSATIGTYALPFTDPTPPNPLWEAAPTESDTTILDIFRGVASQNSQEKLIEFGELSLRADDFWRTVSAKSAHLRQIYKRHVGDDLPPGASIGVPSHRSLETLSDMVAILFAGGSFVPYDPRDPEDRVRYVLDDADVKLRLCHGHAYSRDDQWLEELSRGGERTAATLLPAAATRDQLAYVIYTSGSSGRPKGVRVSHGALWHYAQWFGALEPCHLSRRIDFSTNLTFDAAITTTLVALAHGKSIAVCPEATKNSPRAFLSYLIESRIDLCKCTPSYFRLLVNEADHGDVRIPQRMAWLLGGEEMGAADAARWLDRHPHHAFYNSYGPTEATVTCSKFKVDRNNVKNFPTSIPIEKDSRAARFHILDAKRRPLPHGVKGELYLEGPILADGYQNKPEETSAAFVAIEGSERWYRTGDQVMSLPDGTIHYYGRLDDQVKVRGIRVELEEIRRIICAFDGVADAKVLTHEVQGYAQLFAFVVPREAPAAEAHFVNRLEQHLLSKLPAAITPQHILLLDRLPFNLAGKADVQALRQMIEGRTFSTGKMLVVNPLEMALLQVWRDFLPPGKIGTDSNFFNLGGNSLLAMEVMDQVNRLLNVALPPDILFRRPTIRELGQAITERCAITNILHFNDRKHGPALALIHPATGLAHLYQSLSPAVAATDFYGVSNDRFGERENPYPSLDEMASAYVAKLLAKRPQGPYVVGGFCTGGVVALEVARKLEYAGHEVRGLILIDSFKLGDVGTEDERAAYNRNQLELAGIGEESYLGQRIAHELEHNRKLVVDHEPGRFSGPCLFIQCRNIEPDDVNRRYMRQLKNQLNGWAPFLGSAEVKHIEVDASHKTIFRDEAIIGRMRQEIAAFLGEILGAASGTMRC